MAGIPTLDPEQLSPLSLRRREPGARTRAALTSGASVAAHASLLGALLVLPLVLEQPLPDQAHEVHAFLVAPPALSVAPPPPPPAPARAPRPVEAPRPAPADALTAPVSVPESIVPEAGLELGLEGGAAAGVPGGVPGGVVGGVVGGIVDALPEPPPLKPLRVGAAVKEPRKIKDVQPVYPALARSSRIQGVVILECLLDTRGRVQEARVLRGVPLLDEAALEAVRQWVYSTTLVDGVPVSVIMTVTVSFRLG